MDIEVIKVDKRTKTVTIRWGTIFIDFWLRGKKLKFEKYKFVQAISSSDDLWIPDKPFKKICKIAGKILNDILKKEKQLKLEGF